MEQQNAGQRTKLLATAGVLVLVFAVWAFLEFEPLRHRALTYEEPSACRGNGGWQPAAYSTSWEGATFLIRATEYPNCADEKVKRVSAHVIGERVFLRIRYHSPSGETYACHCLRVTQVRLAGLEKRDYRIMPVFPP